MTIRVEERLEFVEVPRFGALGDTLRGLIDDLGEDWRIMRWTHERSEGQGQHYLIVLLERSVRTEP